jgi:hypothetical protein
LNTTQGRRVPEGYQHTCCRRPRAEFAKSVVPARTKCLACCDTRPTSLPSLSGQSRRSGDESAVYKPRMARFTRGIPCCRCSAKVPSQHCTRPKAVPVLRYIPRGTVGAVRGIISVRAAVVNNKWSMPQHSRVTVHGLPVSPRSSPIRVRRPEGSPAETLPRNGTVISL